MDEIYDEAAETFAMAPTEAAAFTAKLAARDRSARVYRNYDDTSHLLMCDDSGGFTIVHLIDDHDTARWLASLINDKLRTTRADRQVDGYGEGAHTVDGVRLATRTGSGDIRHMIKIIDAIERAYEVPPSETVASIYVDDKTCAYYEVKLADRLTHGWDKIFAEEIRDIFRQCGGYNGLIIRNGRRETMLQDDPWWKGESDHEDLN